ncbi:MAG: M20/M25/M40 family metallo-hydrolase [Planctomycetota bacterium]|nr:M20/M25/M40 family metallo-hydrolase [Planctomycetota bacterium]
MMMTQTQWMMVVGLAVVCAGSLAGCVHRASYVAPPTVQATEAGAVPSEKAPEMVERAIGGIDEARLRYDVDQLAEFGTRHTLSDVESASRGIGAARRWVKQRFEEEVAAGLAARGGLIEGMEGQPRVYFDAHVQGADNRRIPRDVEIVNVVCEIPGTDAGARGRHYYVLAHLDSRNSDPLDGEGDAPGANDAASGVAMMIEMARHLSAHPPEATVVLMATSGEEQGLYGARLHAMQVANEGRIVMGVLNNDTVGDPYGKHARDSEEGRAARKVIRVFSQGVGRNATPGEINMAAVLGAESDSEARQIARYMSMVAHWHRLPVKPALIFRNDRFLRGGDHTAFLDAGYAPSVRVTVPYEDYDRQHQDVRVEDGRRYGDEAEFIDEGYLADVTALNLASVMHLAMAPSAPTEARLITAELTTDTTMRWTASPEGDVAGYEVVYRRTTSPVWEKAIDVGNVTEATVDLSKDNWLFGVRAYDGDGYRSPVVFPGAGRE